MPPTLATMSRTQAEMQDPSTVEKVRSDSSLDEAIALVDGRDHAAIEFGRQGIRLPSYWSEPHCVLCRYGRRQFVSESLTTFIVRSDRAALTQEAL